MIVAMAQLALLGRREDLDRALATLQQTRAAEVVVGGPAGPSPGPGATPAGGEPESALAGDLDRIEALLGHLPPGLPVEPDAGPAPSPYGPAELRDRLPELAAAVAEVGAEREALRAETEQLEHQVGILARLGALVPELSSLSDAELALLQLATVVLMLDDPDGRVVATLAAQLTERLGDRHLLVTTRLDEADRPGSGAGTEVGCLLVVSRPRLAEVEQLLGADRINRVSVPAAYAGRSLQGTVEAMRRRLAELPDQQAELQARTAGLIGPYVPGLVRLRADLAARLERVRAAGAAELTERTFALRVWVPRPRVREVADSLTEALPTVVVAPVPRRDWAGPPPVLLSNRPRWRPYERLVGFLSWPSPAGTDPTGLMALMLPFLFGVMVGDVVYGLVLAGLGWWVRRRWADRPVLVDAGRVLVAGGAWATVFGFLYGEALGSLGNTLGMPALWFYRGGPAALEPLLLFAVAIGAAHIVLGLALGVWTAIRQRQRSRIADRAGTLLVLIGLFAVAGVLARALPPGLLTPAVIAVILGAVIATVSHGALGLLLGPLELLGTLGNVLSYLRVAAVGLASVYLANVANELAGDAPLLLGLLIGVFFHVLNLALAAFSPTVQALRLHYVEFFSKFYDGDGRLFRPLGQGLVLPSDAERPHEPAVADRPEPPVPVPSAGPPGAGHPTQPVGRI